LQFEAPKKEQIESRWRNSILSDSAVARRRTYDGGFGWQAPKAEAKAHSRFSTASLASLGSLQTLDTYCTAKSSILSWHTAPSIIDNDLKEKEGSVIRRTFRRLLQRNGLTPLDHLDEQEEEHQEEYDWCGRGMHVDFLPREKIPLEVCDSAGHGSTSSVDIVKCRRIKLARKLTYMTPRTNEKILLKEAQALQKLRHAHVVQLIGTYRQGRKFAALLYPVADMDLAAYLDAARYMSDAKDDWVYNTWTSGHERVHQDVLSKGSLCLVSALRYVHENGVKHMDIKPANILLKKYKTEEALSNNIAYKLYLCDFGIAQALNPDEQSQTETYFGSTPMYASPEVAAEGSHGRASDVFSLGCVLLEMATVFSGLTVESLKTHIQSNIRYHYYHNNLDRIAPWIYTLDDMEVSNKVILAMLEENPEKRPTLIRQRGATNVIELECLHHHDPPDLFEEDPAPPATESVLEPADPGETSQSEKLPPSEAPVLRDSLELYRPRIL
jgi:serine/threonine protein kinase